MGESLFNGDELASRPSKGRVMVPVLYPAGVPSSNGSPVSLPPSSGPSVVAPRSGVDENCSVDDELTAVPLGTSAYNEVDEILMCPDTGEVQDGQTATETFQCLTDSSYTDNLEHAGTDVVDDVGTEQCYEDDVEHRQASRHVYSSLRLCNSSKHVTANQPSHSQYQVVYRVYQSPIWKRKDSAGADGDSTVRGCVGCGWSVPQLSNDQDQSAASTASHLNISKFCLLLKLVSFLFSLSSCAKTQQVKVIWRWLHRIFSAR